MGRGNIISPCWPAFPRKQALSPHLVSEVCSGTPGHWWQTIHRLLPFPWAVTFPALCSPTSQPLCLVPGPPRGPVSGCIRAGLLLKYLSSRPSTVVAFDRTQQMLMGWLKDLHPALTLHTYLMNSRAGLLSSKCEPGRTGNISEGSVVFREPVTFF